MTWRDFGWLVVLGAIWGASYLFLRVATGVLGAFVLIDLRVLIAGGMLLLYAWWIGHRPALRSRWRALLVLGAINAALPFTFIASATLHLNASIAAILNATTPFFGAVVAAVWLKERLDRKKLLGLALGLAGVAVLVGWNPLGTSAGVFLGVLFSLAGAFCYGIAGVYSKVTFPGMASLDLAIGQQLAAGLWLLPFALATAQRAPLTLSVVAAVLALALLSTAVGYLIYFDLIAKVGPTNTLSVTFLVPIFATFWGVAFLHEPLRPSMLLGLAIILTGVFLVTGLRLPGPWVTVEAGS